MSTVGLASMFGVWCVLLLWSRLAPGAQCVISALFLVLLTAAVLLSVVETAFRRRHAFVHQYLRAGGWLFRLLQRRTFTTVWQSVKALLLGFVLLVSALQLDRWQWTLLLVDVAFMAALVTGCRAVLQAEVRSRYLGSLARQWAVRLNAVVLWLASVLVMFFSAHENYAGLRWEAVVEFSALQFTVGCDVVGVLARFSAVAQALTLWAAQNLFAGLERPAQVSMAWWVFLVSFGASFIIAWAYSRALAGVLSRPWQIWRLDESESG